MAETAPTDADYWARVYERRVPGARKKLSVENAAEQVDEFIRRELPGRAYPEERFAGGGRGLVAWGVQRRPGGVPPGLVLTQRHRAAPPPPATFVRHGRQRVGLPDYAIDGDRVKRPRRASPDAGLLANLRYVGRVDHLANRGHPGHYYRRKR